MSIIRTSIEILHRHKDSKNLWTKLTEGHAHDVTVPDPPSYPADVLTAAQVTGLIALLDAQKYQGAIPP